MNRKKEQQRSQSSPAPKWNDDDFNLDSHGVEAPKNEVFEWLAEIGMPPSRVAVDIQAAYTKYLERQRKRAQAAAELRQSCRGSRKHVLDWLESPQFLPQLMEMLKPVEVVIADDASYRPRGYASPEEARLDRSEAGPVVLEPARKELRNWWLTHTKGANTPNWDLALEGQIEGRPGLVLVEAKANHPEHRCEGKPLGEKCSKNSRENHEHIAQAIADARAGWRAAGHAVEISIGRHYQLANRVAFLWKLASLGIPTVMVYLGFTGDAGIRDAGAPFEDHRDWCRAFDAHVQKILPASVRERRLDIDGTPAWLLARSRVVLGQSPVSSRRISRSRC
jgi:hypothetical protein